MEIKRNLYVDKKKKKWRLIYRLYNGEDYTWIDTELAFSNQYHKKKLSVYTGSLNHPVPAGAHNRVVEQIDDRVHELWPEYCNREDFHPRDIRDKIESEAYHKEDFWARPGSDGLIAFTRIYCKKHENKTLSRGGKQNHWTSFLYYIEDFLMYKYKPILKMAKWYRWDKGDRAKRLNVTTDKKSGKYDHLATFDQADEHGVFKWGLDLKLDAIPHDILTEFTKWYHEDPADGGQGSTCVQSGSEQRGKLKTIIGKLDYNKVKSAAGVSKFQSDEINNENFKKTGSKGRAFKDGEYEAWLGFNLDKYIKMLDKDYPASKKKNWYVVNKRAKANILIYYYIIFMTETGTHFADLLNLRFGDPKEIDERWGGGRVYQLDEFPDLWILSGWRAKSNKSGSVKYVQILSERAKHAMDRVLYWRNKWFLEGDSTYGAPLNHDSLMTHYETNASTANMTNKIGFEVGIKDRVSSYWGRKTFTKHVKSYPAELVMMMEGRRYKEGSMNVRDDHYEERCIEKILTFEEIMKYIPEGEREKFAGLYNVK